MVRRFFMRVVRLVLLVRISTHTHTHTHTHKHLRARSLSTGLKDERDRRVIAMAVANLSRANGALKKVSYATVGAIEELSVCDDARTASAATRALKMIARGREDGDGGDLDDGGGFDSGGGVESGVASA